MKVGGLGWTEAYRSRRWWAEGCKAGGNKAECVSGATLRKWHGSFIIHPEKGDQIIWNISQSVATIVSLLRLTHSAGLLLGRWVLCSMWAWGAGLRLVFQHSHRTRFGIQCRTFLTKGTSSQPWGFFGQKGRHAVCCVACMGIWDGRVLGGQEEHGLETGREPSSLSWLHLVVFATSLWSRCLCWAYFHIDDSEAQDAAQDHSSRGKDGLWPPGSARSACRPVSLRVLVGKGDGQGQKSAGATGKNSLPTHKILPADTQCCLFL